MPLFQSPLFQVPWNSSRSIRGHCGTAREPWSQHSSPMHTVQQRWGGCCLHHCAVFHPGFLISTCCICGGLFTLWSIYVFSPENYFCFQGSNFIWPYLRVFRVMEIVKSIKKLDRPRVLLADLLLSKLRNNRVGNWSDHTLPSICSLQEIKTTQK